MLCRDVLDKATRFAGRVRQRWHSQVESSRLYRLAGEGVVHRPTAVRGPAVSSAAFLKGGNKRDDADGAVFWEAVPRSTAWLGS